MGLFNKLGTDYRRGVSDKTLKVLCSSGLSKDPRCKLLINPKDKKKQTKKKK